MGGAHIAALNDLIILAIWHQKLGIENFGIKYTHVKAQKQWIPRIN